MSDPIETAAQAEVQLAKETAKVKASGTPVVSMPFGKYAPLTPFISQSFGYRSAKEFLHSPEKMLDHPKPGYHYAWPKKDDPQTQARIRSGRYEPVQVKELRKDTDAEITTHKGTHGEYVLWYQHILVGISPKAWEELYDAPVAHSVVRLSQHIEGFQHEVKEASKGVATASVEVSADS